MQIDRTNWIEIILQEFPAFRRRWDEHLASWSPVIDRPVALDIAEFSDFALELIQTGTDAEIDRLSTTLERMLVEGDAIVNYTFRMMFLKNIIDRSQATGVPIDRFITKLQPIAAYYCQALDLFWGDNISVVIPDEDAEAE